MNKETKPEWEVEFDKQFGVTEESAGCDGCSINARIRAEHKEFVTKALHNQRGEIDLMEDERNSLLRFIRRKGLLNEYTQYEIEQYQLASLTPKDSINNTKI